jgi:ribosome recycling factor
MSDNDIKILNQELQKILNSLSTELKSFKTGRANVDLLDHIHVNVYNSSMPLKQIASINVVDAHLIQITPYDNNNLAEIVNAIRNDSSLNLNPVDDGHQVRLNIPPLTEERRKELTKLVNQKSEEYLIRIRQQRHDIMNRLNQEKSNKTISEDDMRMLNKKIEDAINQTKDKLEEIVRHKNKEIMTI